MEYCSRLMEISAINSFEKLGFSGVDSVEIALDLSAILVLKGKS